MLTEIKSAITTLLFCAAISCNMALAADLPVSSDIKMLGEEESGGVVFQVGKSQVCIKISGNVTAEIDNQNNRLILREGDPVKGDEIQYQSGAQSDSKAVQQHEFTEQYVDAQLRKMKQK